MAGVVGHRFNADPRRRNAADTKLPPNPSKPIQAKTQKATPNIQKIKEYLLQAEDFNVLGGHVLLVGLDAALQLGHFLLQRGDVGVADRRLHLERVDSLKVVRQVRGRRDCLALLILVLQMLVLHPPDTTPKVPRKRESG